MRLTIIQDDLTVGIDGRFTKLLDLASLLNDPLINAIQWYDTHGEIEYNNPDGTASHSTAISTLDAYYSIIDKYDELIAIEDAPPEPITDPLKLAVKELKDNGINNNTVTAALFIQVTKAESAAIDLIEAEIDRVSSVYSIDYETVSTAVFAPGEPK